jgi:hypothetical protein
MIYVLLVMLMVCIVVIFQQQRYRRRLVKTSTRLIGDLNYKLNIRAEQLRELEQDNIALEEGNQEIVDNYENDFLDLRAKAEAAKNAAEYDREKREEAEKKLSQWDAAIQNHAGHCDTILHEMVDTMMEDILPKSE